MTRAHSCPICGAEALAGYRHCPAHLQDYETFTIDPEQAARFMPIYAAEYEDAAIVGAVEVYDRCAQGYEIASRYTDWRGCLMFCVVLAD